MICGISTRDYKEMQSDNTHTFSSCQTVPWEGCALTPAMCGCSALWGVPLGGLFSEPVPWFPLEPVPPASLCPRWLQSWALIGAFHSKGRGVHANTEFWPCCRLSGRLTSCSSGDVFRARMWLPEVTTCKGQTLTWLVCLSGQENQVT